MERTQRRTHQIRKGSSRDNTVEQTNTFDKMIVFDRDVIFDDAGENMLIKEKSLVEGIQPAGGIRSIKRTTRRNIRQENTFDKRDDKGIVFNGKI